jgi:hypothetical protein
VKLASSVIFSVIVLSSSVMYAQEQKRAGFGERLFDIFAGGVYLGGQEASPDVQEYVRAMLKEAHVPYADSVRIRRLAKRKLLQIIPGVSLIKFFLSIPGLFLYREYQKVTSCDVLFLPKYIYVNESFFRKLPENQRRFLVGREIMHLKYRLNVWQDVMFILVLLISKLFELNKSVAQPVDSAEVSVPTQVPTWLKWFVLRVNIKKLLEISSDFIAARKFNTAQGGIDFINHHFIDDEQEPKVNRYLRGILNFFFGAHPLPEFRRNLLERAYEQVS